MVALEGSGGVVQMGVMTTDDHGGRVMLSLNDIVRIGGQGDRCTMIIGGIAYPCVVAASTAAVHLMVADVRQRRWRVATVGVVV